MSVRFGTVADSEIGFAACARLLQFGWAPADTKVQWTRVDGAVHRLMTAGVAKEQKVELDLAIRPVAFQRACIAPEMRALCGPASMRSSLVTTTMARSAPIPIKG